ncbi:MAG: NAD(P)-dependent oxidoreductase [Lewinellaceae bacterium]|nr:NAD(P)-dependent oxidoreductase [Lewinellaceae bacterium]
MNKVSSTCLITGANGFIGTFLVKSAQSAGLNVIAGVRQQSNIDSIKDLGITILRIDYSSAETIVDALKGIHFDYIIHNAGVTKALDQNEYYLSNVLQTSFLIEAIQHLNLSLKKFVFISSLAAYGPVDFKIADYVSNKNTPNPVTDYGRSKLQAESLVTSTPNLPYVIIRPTAVYGPGELDLYQVFVMVSKGIAFVPKVEDQTLTFVYVQDLVDVVIKAAVSEHTNCSFFVSDGKNYQTKSLPKEISRAMGKKIFFIETPLFLIHILAEITGLWGKIMRKPPILNKDKLSEVIARSWACDMQSTMNALDFKPQFELAEGVKNTVRWYVQKDML